MQVILQGSLKHFPPAELLAFLCHPGRKGTLDLEASGRRTRVLFDNDKILSAQSRTGGDDVDALLEVVDWQDGTFTLLDDAVLPEGSPALHSGSYTSLNSVAGTYVYLRELNGEQKLIALNFTADPKNFTLPKVGKITLSTMLDRDESISAELVLRPHEGVIVELS